MPWWASKRLGWLPSRVHPRKASMNGGTGAKEVCGACYRVACVHVCVCMCVCMYVCMCACVCARVSVCHICP